MLDAPTALGRITPPVFENLVDWSANDRRCRFKTVRKCFPSTVPWPVHSDRTARSFREVERDFP